ncbi:unnamed protein product [marine sediment metagenome]|uniref:Ribbon-helix-helix protein CopG domain-containing protein n=1 Tax=marine sediment metagenome TaxID=412755 RepID=X1DRW9_9ZZZZ
MMTKKEFRSITIPEGLYIQFKKILESDGTYTSVSEIIREALRQYLKNKGDVMSK